MAGRVVPNPCVLDVGMSIKDLDEDGDDQYMHYLVIPTAPPSKATQLFKDRTDVFAQIPKDQWEVSVTWLTRSGDRRRATIVHLSLQCQMRPMPSTSALGTQLSVVSLGTSGLT